MSNFRASSSRTQAGRYRAASHDSAHSAGPVPPLQVVSHPLICAGEAELIDTPQGLSGLLAHLRQAGQFAYDSEFIGELTYIPKLCLIQVATPQRIGLIDPMAAIDLSEFWKLLADASVRKIVHAGLQDMEPVFRHIEQPAVNVLDTQIAAGFAGLAYPVSLSKLVAEVTGVQLGKGLTFTHWDQRPLSPMQLRYAADDVRYLIAVADGIEKRLSSLGHSDWAAEESQEICDPSKLRFDAETGYERIRGSGTLVPKALAVLKELANWRDATARQQNVPARSLLRDEVLIDLARYPVKTIDKLIALRGFPRPVAGDFGDEILAAINTGLAVSSDQQPQRQEIEPTPAQRFEADAIWATVQCMATAQGIDPALVTARGHVVELVHLRAQGQDVSQNRLMQGWRGKAIGAPLLKLLAGESDYRLSWRKGLVGKLEGRNASKF